MGSYFSQEEQMEDKKEDSLDKNVTHEEYIDVKEEIEIEDKEEYIRQENEKKGDDILQNDEMTPDVSLILRKRRRNRKRKSNRKK